jgi:hypothetical protein
MLGYLRQCNWMTFSGGQTLLSTMIKEIAEGYWTLILGWAGGAEGRDLPDGGGVSGRDGW